MLRHTTSLAAGIFLFTAVVSTVSGLQCYKCEYNHFTSTNFILRPILNQLSKVSDEHCKMEKQEDRTKVLVRNCPEPLPDQEAKCVRVAGTVKSTFLTIGFHYTTVTRDCVISNKGDPDYSYGCHRKLPSSGTGRSVLSGIFKDLSIGDINFDGTACYFGNLASSSSISRPFMWSILVISVLLLLKNLGK